MQIIQPAEVTETSRTFVCTQSKGAGGEVRLDPATLTVTSDGGIVRVTVRTDTITLVGEQCRELALLFCEVAGMEAHSRR